jgi:hypothetical protein
MLHTHSYIYHQRCIMFLSQYFSFPCQYHSTNAPYSYIHLPPTLYNVSLPVLQFSPVSITPPMLHTHLTTCLHILSRLRMGGYIPPLVHIPLWPCGKLELGQIESSVDITYVMWYLFQYFNSYFSLYSFLSANIRKSCPPPDLCPVAHDESNICFLLILLKRFINAFCFNVNSLLVASSELHAVVQ